MHEPEVPGPLVPQGCLRWIGGAFVVVLLIISGTCLYRQFVPSTEENERAELVSLDSEINRDWRVSVENITVIFEDIHSTMFNDDVLKEDEIWLGSIAPNIRESLEISQLMEENFKDLREHPATKISTTASQYLESSISYWEAVIAYLEIAVAIFEDPPDASDLAARESVYEVARERVLAAEGYWKRVRCAFAQLVGYVNADEVCAS